MIFFFFFFFFFNFFFKFFYLFIFQKWFLLLSRHGGASETELQEIIVRILECKINLEMLLVPDFLQPSCWFIVGEKQNTFSWSGKKRKKSQNKDLQMIWLHKWMWINLCIIISIVSLIILRSYLPINSETNYIPISHFFPLCFVSFKSVILNGFFLLLLLLTHYLPCNLLLV